MGTSSRKQPFFFLPSFGKLLGRCEQLAQDYFSQLRSVRCCTASIDRSSEKHRVTGQWRRSYHPPATIPSFSLNGSPSLSHHGHFSGLARSVYSFPCFSNPRCYNLPPSVSLLQLDCAILSSLSVAQRRAALSEFHFRPITIHPRFKAAVTLRSSWRASVLAESNNFFSSSNPSRARHRYFSMTKRRTLLIPGLQGAFIGPANGNVSIRGKWLIEERSFDYPSRLLFARFYYTALA